MYVRIISCVSRASKSNDERHNQQENLSFFGPTIYDLSWVRFGCTALIRVLMGMWAVAKKRAPNHVYWMIFARLRGPKLSIGSLILFIESVSWVLYLNAFIRDRGTIYGYFHFHWGCVVLLQRHLTYPTIYDMIFHILKHLKPDSNNFAKSTAGAAFNKHLLCPVKYERQ